MSFYEEKTSFESAITSLTKNQIKALKAGALKLNNVEGNEVKIKIVAHKVADIVKDLTSVVETLNEAGTEMPDEPIDFFNNFWPNVEDPKKSDPKPPAAKKDPKPAAKKDPKPAAKKDPKPAAKKKKTVEKEKDEYNFGVGTMNSKFVKSIAKKPKTMGEIKKEAWNPKGATFYDVYNSMKERGLADRDKDKKMFIIIKK